MKSEEDIIEEFISRLTVSEVGMTPLEDFVRANAIEELQMNECREILKKMTGKGFITIEIPIGNSRFYIIATELGRYIATHGGYKKYLAEQVEKQKKESELHVFAKETNEYSKSIKAWTIRAFWAVIVVGIAGILVSLYIYFFPRT